MSNLLIESELPTSSTAPLASAAQEQLPFDIWTVAKSLWQWRWVMLIWVVVCTGAGVAGSWFFAPRIWEAETVLLYKPPSAELLSGTYEPPSISTQLNMVKVKDNLSDTRRLLELPCQLSKLGSAIKVNNPRDSQLLVFHVRWSDPKSAAPIANTISEVFVKKRMEMRHSEVGMIVKDVQQRFDAIQEKLLNAGGARRRAQQAAERANRIKLLTARMEGADQEYDSTVAEKQAEERKLAKLDQMVEEEREKFEDEQAETASSESLSSLNIRAERLNEKIRLERAEEVNRIKKDQWQARLEYSERLLARGFLTKVEYEAEQAEYKKFLASVEDNKHVKQLLADREKIFEAMQISGPGAAKMSSAIRDLMSQRKRLVLTIEGLVEKIAACDRKRKELQRQYVELLHFTAVGDGPDDRLVLEWRREADELQDTLTLLRAIHNSKTPDFTFVSKAKEATVPTKSYRKLFCVGIAGIGAMFGLIGIVAYELVDTTVKSRADVALRLDQRVLGLLPNVRQDSKSPESWEACLLEPIRGIVRRIRAEFPHRGARFFIVSAGEDEGVTTVASHLARCFGQQGENVLLVDGEVRDAYSDEDLREIAVAHEETPRGLGEFLAGNVEDVAEVICPTTLYGVSCIPRSGHPVVPELLSSKRMFDVMKQLSKEHDVILIDGPHAASNADAEILSAQADGILFVVQSSRFRSPDINKALDRLTATGAPVLGVVLNRVEPLFMDSEWK